MAIEQGIVLKTGLKGGERDIALVKTIPHSGCEACSSRSQCNPGSGGKEQEVEAVNLVNAKEGDLIQISIETQALLQATFLLYIFPILCLLIGAFFGDHIGTKMNISTSMSSLLIGASCFLAAMFLVRRRARHMANKLKYQPKITRVLGRGNSTVPNGCEAHPTRST